MSGLKKVLVTTPDFPPRLGGLSTFSKNIVSSLEEVGINPDLKVWNNINEARSIEKSDQYDHIINIQLMGGFFQPQTTWNKHINFYHGSELAFTSPNLIKALYKKVFRGKFTDYMEACRFNFFISEYTLELAKKKGLNIDYRRDIVLHNGINLNDAKLVNNDLNSNELILVCVARDVPHKNIEGVVRVAEGIKLLSGKEVTLNVTSSRFRSDTIKINDISGVSDEQREELFQNAHLNLLLSKDHSKKGFFEGFGLTVLEAGKFGVPSIGLAQAGLKESIHHGKTGWLLTNTNLSELEQLWHKELVPNYHLVRNQCFQHTSQSHSTDIYKRLFEAIL